MDGEGVSRSDSCGYMVTSCGEVPVISSVLTSLLHLSSVRAASLPTCEEEEEEEKEDCRLHSGTENKTPFCTAKMVIQKGNADKTIGTTLDRKRESEKREASNFDKTESIYSGNFLTCVSSSSSPPPLSTSCS